METGRRGTSEEEEEGHTKRRTRKGSWYSFHQIKKTNHEIQVSLLHIIWGGELLAQAMNFVAGDFHPERGGAAPGRMEVR